MCYALCPKV
nr:unnamed protein product [Callosobruchus analis]